MILHPGVRMIGKPLILRWIHGQFCHWRSKTPAIYTQNPCFLVTIELVSENKVPTFPSYSFQISISALSLHSFDISVCLHPTHSFHIYALPKLKQNVGPFPSTEPSVGEGCRLKCLPLGVLTRLFSAARQGDSPHTFSFMAPSLFIITQLQFY